MSEAPPGMMMTGLAHSLEGVLDHVRAHGTDRPAGDLAHGAAAHRVGAKGSRGAADEGCAKTSLVLARGSTWAARVGAWLVLAAVVAGRAAGVLVALVVALLLLVRVVALLRVALLLAEALLVLAVAWRGALGLAAVVLLVLDTRC